VCNKHVAICVALILTTDAPFILTNVFDWGPVCLLLLSTVSFLNFLQRFGGSGKRRFLAAGFVIAGIAAWYKPLFLAVLVALSLAWLVAFRGDIRRYVLPANAVIVVIAFGVGVAPLVAFNVHAPFATLRASGYLPTVPVSEKLLMLRRTLDGRGLEHY